VRVIHDQHPGTLTDVPQEDATSQFATACAVRTENGGFFADLDGGWNVGPGILNGGYLLAVTARAAVIESPHPHPVALSASYLRATGPGEVELFVTPGAAGRTLAHSQVLLGDPDYPNLSVQVTTATLGDAVADHAVPVPSIPPVADCLPTRTASEGPGSEVGIREYVDVRLDPSTAGWAVGKPSGDPVVRGWVQLADGAPADPFALAMFADILPPSVWSMGMFGWTPTVQLQVLVRALPAPGWCLVEARTNEVAGGWIDEDYRIWDSTGRLVAQSRQLARTPR
jgi:hypothetical protein